ncbi:hypothetical protein BKA64DRAFT_32205 [Cadophora sp. MPI-SDFR-AT-0126]|nr:hypothetical protein BKA64DRAFT_32205 [Leotiomycetes sp. MPI-SDFR-AT-0126]
MRRGCFIYSSLQIDRQRVDESLEIYTGNENRMLLRCGLFLLGLNVWLRMWLFRRSTRWIGSAGMRLAWLKMWIILKIVLLILVSLGLAFLICLP